MSEPNYQEAFEELQQIVAEMEEGQITVDELTDKVSRAANLIKICKAKLNAAEQNVQEILSSIENQEIMDEGEASVTEKTMVVDSESQNAEDADTEDDPDPVDDEGEEGEEV